MQPARCMTVAAAYYTAALSHCYPHFLFLKKIKKHCRACIWRWREMITGTWIPSSPPSALCLVFVHGRDISHNTETCPWPLLSASKSAPSLNRLWELCSATRCRWLFIFEKCNKVGNFIGQWSLLGWNWVFWSWPLTPFFSHTDFILQMWYVLR